MPLLTKNNGALEIELEADLLALAKQTASDALYHAQSNAPVRTGNYRDNIRTAYITIKGFWIIGKALYSDKVEFLYGYHTLANAVDYALRKNGIRISSLARRARRR